ncbi:MAG: hypothetical protein ABIJ28_00530 [Patescibacteria group bacterium]
MYFYPDALREMLFEHSTTALVIVNIFLLSITAAYAFCSFKILEFYKEKDKKDLTLELISKWTDKEMITSSRKILEGSKILNPQKFFPPQNEIDKNIKISIIQVSNYFEILGIYYKNSEIDKNLIDEFFGYIIPHLWEILEPFVLKAREEHRHLLFENFEYLKNEINNLKERSRK